MPYNINKEIIIIIKVEDLVTIEKRAKEIFSDIKKKYPTIKAYLVLSSNKGQCNLTSKIEGIFDSFPTCIVDSDASGFVKAKKATGC